MKKGLIGKKIGMTQIFNEEGKVIPVTVIEAGPCVVSQVKTEETDGYNSIQLGFGAIKESKVNKPERGHFTKANIAPARYLREFRVDSIEDVKVGDELKADIFMAGDKIDIQGTSKGKGFQGTIKRHNFSRGPMGHGSHYHRAVGSRGPMRPMRVLKGKKLPGHMGNETVTIQNLEIIAVDVENNCLLISGNIPGPKKGYVIVRTAIKNGGKVEAKELVSYVVEEVIENNEVVTEELTETVDTPVAEETATETPEKEDAE